MKATTLLIILLSITTLGMAQSVQRPGYGYRNEVDTSKHLINGFGISALDFNGTANAVIKADSAAVATPYDISFKVNIADSSGNAAGNYVPHTQLTTAQALKVNIADSSGNAAGNYVPHKQLTTAQALKVNIADSSGNAAGNYVPHTQLTTAQALKVNVADSTGNAAGNYVTHTQVSATYSPIASPTFTGTVTAPALVVSSTDTTGTAVVGKIIYRVADSSFYGCRSTLAAHKWFKLND